MTTIAIDRTTVAADGQRTWGGEIRGLNHKKLRIQDGRIYAFTGLTPMFEPMIVWHVQGADPKELPVGVSSDEGWTLIVVDGDGVGKYTNSCPYVEHLDSPIAFGAGQDYAIGAMLVGASAKQAVEAVASLCNHTGGEIQVIDIAEALGQSVLMEAAE